MTPDSFLIPLRFRPLLLTRAMHQQKEESLVPSPSSRYSTVVPRRQRRRWSVHSDSLWNSPTSDYSREMMMMVGPFSSSLSTHLYAVDCEPDGLLQVNSITNTPHAMLLQDADWNQCRMNSNGQLLSQRRATVNRSTVASRDLLHCSFGEGVGYDNSLTVRRPVPMSPPSANLPPPPPPSSNRSLMDCCCCDSTPTALSCTTECFATVCRFILRFFFRLSTCFTIPFFLLLVSSVICIIFLTDQYLEEQTTSSWESAHELQVSIITAVVGQAAKRTYVAASTFSAMYDGHIFDIQKDTLSVICALLSNSHALELRTITVGSPARRLYYMCAITEAYERDDIPMSPMVGGGSTDDLITALYYVDKETFSLNDSSPVWTTIPPPYQNTTARMNAMYAEADIFDSAKIYHKENKLDQLPKEKYWQRQSKVQPFFLFFTYPLFYKNVPTLSLLPYRQAVVANTGTDSNATVAEESPSSAPDSSAQMPEFIEVIIDGSALLGAAPPQHVSALLLSNASIREPDPVVISNNWGQPLTDDPSIVSYMNNPSLLRLSQVSDKLMQTALRHIHLRELTAARPIEAEFRYYKEWAKVSARILITDSGLVLPLVVASETHSVVGRYMANQVLFTVAESIFIFICTILFWALIEVFFSVPLREIAAALDEGARSRRFAGVLRTPNVKRHVLQLREITALKVTFEAAMAQLCCVASFLPHSARLRLIRHRRSQRTIPTSCVEYQHQVADTVLPATEAGEEMAALEVNGGGHRPHPASHRAALFNMNLSTPSSSRYSSRPPSYTATACYQVDHSDDDDNADLSTTSRWSSSSSASGDDAADREEVVEGGTVSVPVLARGHGSRTPVAESTLCRDTLRRLTVTIVNVVPARRSDLAARAAVAVRGADSAFAANHQNREEVEQVESFCWRGSQGCRDYGPSFESREQVDLYFKLIVDLCRANHGMIETLRPDRCSIVFSASVRAFLRQLRRSRRAAHPEAAAEGGGATTPHSFNEERANTAALLSADGSPPMTALERIELHNREAVDATAALSFSLALHRHWRRVSAEALTGRVSCTKRHRIAGPLPAIHILLDTHSFTVGNYFRRHAAQVHHLCMGRDVQRDVGMVLPQLNLAVAMTAETASLVPSSHRILPVDILRVGRDDAADGYEVTLHAPFPLEGTDVADGGSSLPLYKAFCEAFHDVSIANYTAALQKLKLLCKVVESPVAPPAHAASITAEPPMPLHAAAAAPSTATAAGSGGSSRQKEEADHEDGHQRPCPDSLLLVAPPTREEAMFLLPHFHRLRRLCTELLLKETQSVSADLPLTQQSPSAAASAAAVEKKCSLKNLAETAPPTSATPVAPLLDPETGRVVVVPYIDEVLPRSFLSVATGEKWEVAWSVIQNYGAAPLYHAAQAFSDAGRLAVLRVWWRREVACGSNAGDSKPTPEEADPSIVGRVFESLGFIPCMEEMTVLSAEAVPRGVVSLSPFYNGGSVRDIFTRYGCHPLPVDMTRQCLSDVCQALWHLHRGGIAHGFICPESVLLYQEGDRSIYRLQCCFKDYGLASRFFYLPPTTYISPELAADGVPTPASDIYAVGLLLLEMITGQSPWRWAAGQRRNPAELQQLLTGPPTQLATAVRSGVVVVVPVTSAVSCFAMEARKEAGGSASHAVVCDVFRQVLTECLRDNPALRITAEKMVEWVGKLP